MIQGRRILWGMGSHGTIVARYHPLYTIRAYTAGKMCPDIVDCAPDEGITREAVLIAHIRSNAYILFMENEPGTLAGKLVDRVVLDRDCLTIPADENRDICPVMSLPAGEIGYAAADWRARRHAGRGRPRRRQAGLDIRPEEATT